MPPGGSVDSLLKSRMRRRRQFVDCFAQSVRIQRPLYVVTNHGEGVVELKAGCEDEEVVVVDEEERWRHDMY